MRRRFFIHQYKNIKIKEQDQYIHNFRQRKSFIQQNQQTSLQFISKQKLQEIKKIVQESQSLTQIVRKLIPDIVYCMSSKNQLSKIYFQFKRIIKQQRNDDIFPLVKQITFSDFVIVVLKIFEQKKKLFELMNQNEIPIPLYFQYGNEKQNNLNQLKEMIKDEKCSIILNIGSQQGRQIGKTQFIYQLFNLPKEYQYRKQSMFSRNSLYVHKVINENSETIIMDFNGSMKQFPNQLKFIIDKCSLVFFHVKQYQIFDEDTGIINQDFFSLEQYSQIFKQKVKIMILVKDCNQFKDLNKNQVSKLIKNQDKMIFCFLSVMQKQHYNEVSQEINKNKISELENGQKYQNKISISVLPKIKQNKAIDVNLWQYDKQNNNFMMLLLQDVFVQSKKLLKHLYSQVKQLCKFTQIQKSISQKNIQELSIQKQNNNHQIEIKQQELNQLFYQQIQLSNIKDKHNSFQQIKIKIIKCLNEKSIEIKNKLEQVKNNIKTQQNKNQNNKYIYQLYNKNNQLQFKQQGIPIKPIEYKKINIINKLIKQSQLLTNIQQTQSTYYDYFFNYIKSFKLLYRASDHQFSSEKFSQLCGNKDNTLVIVKNRKNKHVFCSYNPQQWGNAKKSLNTGQSTSQISEYIKKSYIFSLTNPQTFNISKETCNQTNMYRKQKNNSILEIQKKLKKQQPLCHNTHSQMTSQLQYFKPYIRLQVIGSFRQFIQIEDIQVFQLSFLKNSIFQISQCQSLKGNKDQQLTSNIYNLYNIPQKQQFQCQYQQKIQQLKMTKKHKSHNETQKYNQKQIKITDGDSIQQTNQLNKMQQIKAQKSSTDYQRLNQFAYRIQQFNQRCYIDSKIMKYLNENNILKQLLSNIIYCDEGSQLQKQKQKRTVISIRLLYRASENQFSVKKFHEICDGISHTLVLIKTQFGKTIGAYTPLSWKDVKYEKHNDQQQSQINRSFLFSLTNQDKLPLRQHFNQTVEYNKEWGPIFGRGKDLIIYDNANNNRRSYANIGNSFVNEKYPKDREQTWKRFSGGNTKFFKILEWQVFQVCFC